VTVSPADPTVFPGTPTTFTATPSSGPTHPVKWYLQGAANGDSITSGGVLTTVEPSGRTLTVLAQDSTEAAGQTTVTVGAAFEPVGDLTASQASNSLNGDVSWSPPATSGGSPIAHFTVTTSGRIPTQTTTGSSVALTNLHPGIIYVITVYPVNTAGTTGPAATTTLLVIPTGTDTFTGGAQGTGTDWNTVSNRLAGYVPGSGDSVCVNGGNPILTASTTIEGLQLSGIITITTGADLTVLNNFTANGTIAGGGTLTLPAGTTSTLDSTNGVLLDGDTQLVN
jgi:hypothetical protein